MKLSRMPDTALNLLDRVSIWHIAAFGLAVRLAALALVPNPQFVDAESYEVIGRELFETGIMSSHIAMPLYAILTYLSGGGLGTDLLNIGLSTLTIVVLHRLVQATVDSDAGGKIAGVIYALWPHAVFYSVTGLSETSFVFLLCLALLFLYEGRFVAGSVLLVLGILNRPVTDLIAPLFILYFALAIHRMSIGQALRRLVLYVTIYGALMLPWWLHNYAKYDSFVRLNLGSGFVLYVGNNPGNLTGGGTGDDQRDNYAVVEEEFGRISAIEDPLERHAAYRDRAVEYIREDPARIAHLAWLKFLRLWRPWPYHKDYQSAAIVAASVLSFAPVLALNFYVFIALGRIHWRVLTPYLVLAGYITAVHMVTIGSVRYRFPLEPLMVALAGFGLANLLWRWSGRERAPRDISATGSG